MRYVLVFHKREGNEGKLTVTITLTRQNVRWTISSPLKAQSNPFQPLFHKTWLQYKLQNKRQRGHFSRNHKLRPFFTFTFSTNCLFSARGKTEANIFIQWCSHQEIIVLIISGLLSFHITLQTVYLPAQRAVVGHKPGWSPSFHVVRHLCSSKTSLWPLPWRANERDEPARWLRG